MNIVIVESAAKAKTINKYLGKDYKVIPSFGHVRDLPPKDGSVLPDDDFAMAWAVDSDSAKTVNEIARAVKGAEKLILATDPDREGEAISWHLLQILQEKHALKGVHVERVAFNAVTKDAIMDAMAHPREIDMPLVDAYLARRALDYLVGFTLSPVLWRKLPGAKSAGRVQSVALRLVCARESEIQTFVTREFWTILAKLSTPKAEEFESRLVSVEGKKLDKFDIPNEAEALKLKAGLEGSAFRVASVDVSGYKRHPQPPFTTSTLQQEASRKLGFSARQTMQVAQRLYEGVDIGGETVGLITYMRTDGVQIVPEAIAQCRGVVGAQFGDRYLPGRPRDYKTKAKNAQEAHEAIRPTDFRRLPADVQRTLKPDEAGLYKLVWQRAVASQMASAELERTTVDIDATGNGNYGLRTSGSVVLFDGFLKLYEEGIDDKEGDDDARLPKMVQGDTPSRRAIEANQHFTEPPPRYTEATLIKKMEELGIGRPSTYASTLNVLKERDYVRYDKKRLIPEDKGRLVTAFLESFFQRYVEYDFTADLEEQLDLISDAKLPWKEVLRDFWRDFTTAVNGTKELRVTHVLDALNEILGRFIFPANADGSDPRKCPSCASGQLGLKIGRYGAFVGCTNYPECRFTRQFDKSQGDAGDGTQATPGDKELGPDPDTGLTIFLKTGRFGPYVQLGAGENSDKPKRASIPKGMSAATLDLAAAIKLLSLPRLVGVHPETGKPITANIGRYGPYVEHDGKYANLDGPEEVFEVGINRAVAVLAEPKKREGRGAAQTALKKLGDHPELGGPVQVMAGRYGPYVKHGKVNATIPKGTEPEALTMEEAVKLLAARAESGKTGKSAKPAKAKSAATKTKKPAKANGGSDKEAKPAKAAKTTKSAKPKPKGKGASQTASGATS